MYLLIDLRTHQSKIIDAAAQEEWCEGVKPRAGARRVWDLEEYLVVEL